MKPQGTGIRDQGTGADLTRWRRLIGPCVVLLAAGLAVAPQLVLGNSCGHDFDFHLVSWLDCLNSWRHGVFYPHWSPSSNFGAGEPRFVFYPPLTWMLGAALGAMLVWTLVPVVLTFLLLAGTGLATRALARQALDDAPATLAGCAALFSGYALFCAYERSAFGELTGGFWIPLLLLFVMRDRVPTGSAWRRALDGSAAPLALVVAGAWLSNAPVGVMASYLLAAVAVAAAVLRRSWAPVVRAGVGAAVGMSLAAVYWIPAAWEQRWVDIRQATSDAGERIESSWLFGRHADPALALHDVELRRVSWIAVSMLLVAFVGMLVAWRRGRLKAHRGWWVILGLIPAVILALQLPVSLPVWNLLPKLRFLQFPWRWLVALEAPMAVFFAVAVWPGTAARLRRRVVVSAACCGAFVAMTAYAGTQYYQVCDDEDSVAGTLETYRSGHGFIGTGEYQPLGADNSLLAEGLPGACLVSDLAKVLGVASSDPDASPVWETEQGSCEPILLAPTESYPRAEYWHFAAHTPHPGYLVLRLRSYPAWRAAVNGQAASDLPLRADGLLAVPVPQGVVDLTVDWTTTPDVAAGRWLSGLGALLVTGLCLLERRLGRPRLS